MKDVKAATEPVQKVSLTEEERQKFIVAMLKAIKILRMESIENIEYNLALLRCGLFEAEIISPEAFAELEKQPIITAEALKEIEKSNFDRLAQNYLKMIKSQKEMAEDPDIVWGRMIRNNKKGNKKISEKELEELSVFLFAHKVQEAEIKLEQIKSTANPFFFAKLIEYIEENKIPYERLETTKVKILMLGV